ERALGLRPDAQVESPRPPRLTELLGEPPGPHGARGMALEGSWISPGRVVGRGIAGAMIRTTQPGPELDPSLVGQHPSSHVPGYNRADQEREPQQGRHSCDRPA
ncbi:hypothetical protein, partial [Nocardioides sp.]|uniref:hypothetical protein n=1 Tax=Nocardioides sp. TaxID=35761 RepID=UPI002736936B